MSEQQLTRNHLIYRAQLFNANLGPTNIPIDHAVELDYSIFGVSSDTTGVTLAEMKAECDEVVMNLGGREIVRLSNQDVADLDNLWFGQTPQVVLGATKCYAEVFEPLTIPLSLDKMLGGALRTLDVGFTFGTAGTHLDPAKVYVYANVPYLSNTNVSWLPAGYHYSYQYRNMVPTTTPSTFVFNRKGSDLVGLLVYNANPPSTTTANDIDWITIYVNNQPVYGPVYWHAMRTFQNTVDQTDDTSFGAEMAHYRYLDLSKAPLPADFLDVESASITNTTGPDRLIGVFIEP